MRVCMYGLANAVCTCAVVGRGEVTARVAGTLSPPSNSAAILPTLFLLFIPHPSLSLKLSILCSHIAEQERLRRRNKLGMKR